jgi:hypothetical protein
LAKEVLHHVPRAERPAALRGLAGLLAPGGRFGRRPVDPAEVGAILGAGGVRAEVTYDSFRVALPKERWLAMVADRYMSLLASFSDDELRAGLSEIDSRYPGPVLEFEDRFAFMLATADRA